MKDNTPQRKIELLLIVSSILNAMTFKNKNKKKKVKVKTTRIATCQQLLDISVKSTMEEVHQVTRKGNERP